MTSQEIKIEIKKIEKRIYEHKNNNSKIDRKIVDFERAKKRINKKHSDFEQEQNHKNKQISKVLSLKDIPMAKGIFEEMRQMYNGRDYSGAEQAFQNAIGKINKRIEECSNKKNDSNREINRLKNRLEELRRKLDEALAKEGAK